jgi:hypothetical protein
MRNTTASGVALLLLVSACHSAPTEKAAPPDAGVTTAQSETVPFGRRLAMRALRDAGEDPLCTKLLEEEKLDASALREEDKTSPGPRVRCFPSGTFVWAIRADRVDAGSAIRQTILFASADGKRARLASKVDGVEWPPVLGHRATLYDFDGDGVPELFAIVAKDVRTYTPASRIFVTMKNQKIAPYPTGGSFQVDGLMDIDRDGRPDLRVSFDVGKRTVCAPTEEGRVEVELAAHSLPDGKFSLTDAAAVAFARKRCPAMPSADALFTPSFRPGGERDLSIQAVACERMRGKTADAVIADLHAACASSADAAKKCSGPCRHLPDAVAAARFSPPLHLVDGPAAGSKR